MAGFKATLLITKESGGGGDAVVTSKAGVTVADFTTLSMAIRVETHTNVVLDADVPVTNVAEATTVPTGVKPLTCGLELITVLTVKIIVAVVSHDVEVWYVSLAAGTIIAVDCTVKAVTLSQAGLHQKTVLVYFNCRITKSK